MISTLTCFSKLQPPLAWLDLLDGTFNILADHSARHEALTAGCAARKHSADPVLGYWNFFALTCAFLIAAAWDFARTMTTTMTVSVTPGRNLKAHVYCSGVVHRAEGLCYGIADEGWEL